MAHKWFETVEIARERARKILPRSVFLALKAGAEAGETLDDNLAAFRELGFVPTVANKAAERDQTTHV
ncbi:MAG: alpha-hydroxy-acid oxidizing protein, partial [Acidimicrobiales bacterium]